MAVAVVVWWQVVIVDAITLADRTWLYMVYRFLQVSTCFLLLCHNLLMFLLSSLHDNDWLPNIVALVPSSPRTLSPQVRVDGMSASQGVVSLYITERVTNFTPLQPLQ